MDYLSAAANYATRKRASKPKRNYTEDKIQGALMQMAALHECKYPPLRWLLSIPNEHALNVRKNEETGEWYCPGGSRLNRLGRKKGAWDLFLPESRGPFIGMWLETKSPGGKLTPEQSEFGAAMSLAGFYCVIYNNWEKGWHRIVDYLERRVILEPPNAIDDTRR